MWSVQDSWESLEQQGSKPVNLEGNQSWIFTGRTDAEAGSPILWPPDANSWLIGKDPDAGQDWRREEKGTTEDEMVGWHHWLNGHGFEQAPGDAEGQGSLAVHGVMRSQTQLSDWTVGTNSVEPRTLFFASQGQVSKVMICMLNWDFWSVPLKTYPNCQHLDGVSWWNSWGQICKQSANCEERLKACRGKKQHFPWRSLGL